MDSETLFYICGGVLAVSALVLTFAGLKLKNFPGRMLPVIVVWFAAFVVGASTFAVRYSQEHSAHATEHESVGEKLESEKTSGPYENEGGALGGEREELEEQAEQEAEGSPEEESIGPTEGSQESGKSPGDEGAGSPQGGGGETGSESGAGASATTLKLAADEADIAFDKEELSAKAGEVTIDFNNPSAIPHNAVIEKDGEEIAGTPVITESEESVSAELEPGDYTFVCTVPGHEQLGMVGTLTVE
ncbi:MAG: plastocyanin/azurin family copper-binding protein [Actinomycetota bacterium]|nr:plastocyanin/azurin family copper-binding protein [Actinomycetota bacterium]